MKTLLKFVLLSCVMSVVVFGDLAMAQPWRNRNATAQPKDIYYKGVKLGVDTPLKILEDAKDNGYSDEGDPTTSFAAQFYTVAG